MSRLIDPLGRSTDTVRHNEVGKKDDIRRHSNNWVVTQSVRSWPAGRTATPSPTRSASPLPILRFLLMDPRRWGWSAVLLLLLAPSCFVRGGDIVHEDDEAPKLPGCSNNFVLVECLLMIVLPLRRFAQTLLICFAGQIWFWEAGGRICFRFVNTCS